MDMEVEMTVFFCSLAAYFILQTFGKRSIKVKGKAREIVAGDCTTKADPVEGHEASENPEKDARNAAYSQMEKSLRDAFEAENYVEALKCWNALKRFRQCAPVHLLHIVKAMQCCNKGAHFIAMELNQFFKAHPRVVNIGLINNILEPLSRRAEDAQLVDLIVRMLPSINAVKDTRTYEILLAMHVASQNHVKANEVITEMKDVGVSFTPCATVAVLTIALQLRKFEVVLQAFKELKPSWDIRSTWAVSPFALQRHKASILTQIVELACKENRLHQLLPALEGMPLPGPVVSMMQAECQGWSENMLVTMMKLLGKSNVAPSKEEFVHSMLSSCLSSRSKTSEAWVKSFSEASTSEGSRSDSECGDQPVEC